MADLEEAQPHGNLDSTNFEDCSFSSEFWPTFQNKEYGKGKLCAIRSTPE